MTAFYGFTAPAPEYYYINVIAQEQEQEQDYPNSVLPEWYTDNDQQQLHLIHPTRHRDRRYRDRRHRDRMRNRLHRNDLSYLTSPNSDPLGASR